MKQSYILKTRELELVEGSRISNGDQVLSGDSSLRASIERRGRILMGIPGVRLWFIILGRLEVCQL